MVFLRLTPDGSIDDGSYDAYVKHLDDIRSHLDPRLYELLRFPATGYQTGKTIHDSILTEWHCVLERDSWDPKIELRILSPNYDRELRFSFQGDLCVTQSVGNRWYGMGALYCLEVSRREDGTFLFCLMNIAREELRIECRRYAFDEVEARHVRKLQ